MAWLIKGCRYRIRNAHEICIELADGEHVCCVRFYANLVHCAVVHDVSCRTVLKHTVYKDRSPGWEDFVDGFQEKAMKYFSKPSKYKDIA